jgi:iron-sulfur cluster insertion protein
MSIFSQHRSIRMTAMAQTEHLETTSKSLLQVTPTARIKLAELLAEAGDEASAIRVFVSGGGCGGMAYGMTYADQTTEYDHVIEMPELKVVVDVVAFNFLQGAEIDFTADSLNPAFVFRNAYQAPKSGGGGCGSGGCGGGGCGR